MACLVVLMVLGLAWTLQSVILTQENFDLEQFMGRWYEVAVVSTCPHYMHRKKENPVIVALELKHFAFEDNFTVTTATFRNGSCKETSRVYSLTNTPGRFFHHVPRFEADVDSFVVHTNYDQHATIVQLSTEKPSGNKTTSVKLYSRTMNTSHAVLDSFKTVVRKHGLSDDIVIINQQKNECAAAEPVTDPSDRPLVPYFLHDDHTSARI
ncbi:protein AMBP-like [Xenentodon cancila]